MTDSCQLPVTQNKIQNKFVHKLKLVIYQFPVTWYLIKSQSEHNLQLDLFWIFSEEVMEELLTLHLCLVQLEAVLAARIWSTRLPCSLLSILSRGNLSCCHGGSLVEVNQANIS